MFLSSDFSLSYLLLSCLLGLIYAFILYYKTKQVFGKTAIWIMFSLRFLSVFLISALLLAPLFKITIKHHEKPLVILGLDNSESILLTQDSLFYKTQFMQDFQSMVKNLSQNYDVRVYTVGTKSELKSNFDFKDKTTNIADFFKQIKTIYAGRNIGAVVLASDGLYNSGVNPVYEVEDLMAPVYTITMGDTTINRDLLISDVLSNKTVFYENYFPVQISVKADKCQGETAELTVLENDKVIFSKSISLNNKHYFGIENITLQATKKGVQSYKVRLSHLSNELTYVNNERTFFIEVLDERQKIAIVYHSPHPDVAAFKETLDKTEQYQIDVISAEQINVNLSDYDVVVLHQLPSLEYPLSSQLKDMAKKGTSILYIISGKTNINAFNNQQIGLHLRVRPNLTNDAFAVYNSNFTSFMFSESSQRLISVFPPLKAPFADYKISGNMIPFMTQNISGLQTNYPLILFGQSERQRNAIILGEGIWRWRLANYLEKENTEAFNEIVEKTILYLAVKTDKSNLLVYAKNRYSENLPIMIDAELYNDSHELTTESDIKFQLQDQDNKIFNYAFSKNNNRYSLNIGVMPIGDYSWNTTVVLGDKTYQKSGHFIVQEIALEGENLTADDALLKHISQITNAKNYNDKQIRDLELAIKENETIKPIIYYIDEYKEILNQWWLMLLLFILLGSEWFMRKWGGAY